MQAGLQCRPSLNQYQVSPDPIMDQFLPSACHWLSRSAASTAGMPWAHDGIMTCLHVYVDKQAASSASNPDQAASWQAHRGTRHCKAIQSFWPGRIHSHGAPALNIEAQYSTATASLRVCFTAVGPWCGSW